MIIFVAGLIGSGKTSLAQYAAQQLNIYYYDVDCIKKEVYAQDPNYEYNIKHNIPFSDETRAKTFHKVVDDFAILATNHKHIIVDETLHKKQLRQILFNGARKYFGSYVVIWIQVDETIIKNRLTQNRRDNHLLTDPLGMYLSFKKQFEHFEDPDNYVVFHNEGVLEQMGEQFIALIQKYTV